MKIKIDHSENQLLLIYFLLIVLWVYTAGSKWMDFKLFEQQMTAQHFGPFLTQILLYILPIGELVVAATLLFKRSQLLGLLLSLLLMSLFSAYIAAIMIGLFPEKPCSCGGVLQQLSWQQHLWFNMFFLLIIGYGLVLKRVRC